MPAANLCVWLLALGLVVAVGGDECSNAGGSRSMLHNNALDPVYVMKDLFIVQLYRKVDFKRIYDIIIGAEGPEKTSDVWQMVQDILAAVAPISACVALGALFFIIMPLTGLFCCCCRICGNCGGKAPTMDPPRAKCKRIGCGFLLLILTTVMLGGVVETFLSVDQLIKQAQMDQNSSAFSRWNPAVETMVTCADKYFLTEPNDKVNNLGSRINATLDSAGPAVFENLTGLSPASMDSSVAAVLNGLSLVDEDLALLSSILSNISMWQDAVNQTLTQMPITCCSNCTIAANVNYTQNGDARWGSNPGSNAIDLAKEASLIFENVVNSFSSSADSAKSSASSVVSGLRKQLNDTLEFWTDFSAKIRLTLAFPSDNDRTEQYSKYSAYGGFGIGSLLAFITLLLYLGLCCGMCGRRPGDDPSTCKKGSGACLLMAAVGFMFIFSWILMMITLVLFPTSALSLPCSLMDGTIKSKLDKFENISDIKIDLGTVDITLGLFESTIRDLKNNQSLYGILESYVPELHNCLSGFENSTRWDNLRNDIGTVQLPAGIAATANQSVVVRDALQNVTQAVSYIMTLGMQSPIIPGIGDLIGRLDQMDQQCNSTRQNLTDLSMISSNQSAVLAAVTLRLHSRLNEGIQAMTVLRNGLKQLQDTGVALQGVNYVINNIKEIANNTVKELKATPGTGLYESVMGTVNILCSDILDPLDAFWFSLGWCVTFFVPIIIVSLCLVSLYRREEPYKRTKERRRNDEQAYIDDAGVTIRDSVPLDNMPQRKSTQRPAGEAYSNTAFSDLHEDGSPNVPPPYFGRYYRGHDQPPMYPSQSNGDVTYARPAYGAAAYSVPGPLPPSQKRY